MRGRYTPEIDISDSTNLAVSSPITLTDDTIGFDLDVTDARYVLQGDHIELIVDGNEAGDNGNWRAIIVGANLEFQKRVGGSWVFAGGFTPP